MDLADVLLFVAFAAFSLLYFEWRVWRLWRTFTPRAIRALQSIFFDETVEDTPDGKKTRLLRPNARSKEFMAAVAPLFVQTALQSIKMKPGVNLPINPVTGQLDFMAPVLQKIASGKKVGVEDFLPLIMDKAMPFVEGFLGGLGKKGGEKPSETKNPFLKE